MSSTSLDIDPGRGQSKRVNDVKQAYGQDRAHISTVNGAGTKWVSVDRLVREHVALETHSEIITRTSG